MNVTLIRVFNDNLKREKKKKKKNQKERIYFMSYRVYGTVQRWIYEVIFLMSMYDVAI